MLIVNENHLRQVLTELPEARQHGRAAPCSWPAHLPDLTPGQPNRSTSPSTGSAGSKSSVD